MNLLAVHVKRKLIYNKFDIFRLKNSKVRHLDVKIIFYECNITF